ncbi:MAG TPA: DUF5719 family protein [Acidimicrobiales bacterium]|nr:DUF5719 family protein [Acidimicrobiales bacterium]
MTARRRPVLVALAVLLVAGGVADRRAVPRPRLSPAAAARAVMPTAAPPGALSSTWFCVGATAAPGGSADGVVFIANPTGGPVAGAVTVVPVQGEARSVPVTVEARSVTSVALRDVVEAPFAAALVDVDGGQVAAELVVRGPLGSDAAPCSSRASSRWYFADGVTARDASLLLSLFNPFPEDAIVDLSFSTDQGRAAPAAFRPIVVPGRTLVVRAIGDHVRRRNAISTAVAVRTGRVIAAQTQTRTAPCAAGLSVALGAPSLGTEWHFPNGVVADGVAEHFAVSNPGPAEASVLFQVIADEAVVEDFERTVPARGRLDVVLNEEVGMPRGVGHATTIRSLDGVPVVASRTLAYSPPSPRAGRADTLGARRAATRWLFPAGGSAPGTAVHLAVANVGEEPARFSAAGLVRGEAVPLAGIDDVEVGPGRRVVVAVQEHLGADPMPVLVTATAPVVVERDVQAGGGPGAWAGMGIPLG